MGGSSATRTALVTHVLMHLSVDIKDNLWQHIHRSDAEEHNQHDLVRPDDMQTQDHGNRQKQYHNVCDNIDDPSGDIQRCFVQALTSNDRYISVLFEWCAGCKQRDDNGNAGADHDEHGQINTGAEAPRGIQVHVEAEER